MFNVLYLYIASAALPVIALVLLYNFAGSKVRQHPSLLLVIGLLIVASGILINDEVNETKTGLVTQLCRSFSSDVTNCALSEKVSERLKKFIELGFTAVGAGLVALSVDLKSDMSSRLRARFLADEEQRQRDHLLRLEELIYSEFKPVRTDEIKEIIFSLLDEKSRTERLITRTKEERFKILD